MRAITESGLRVGADISVVGYDDTEDSSCYIPPLTTIKQDFRLLGKRYAGPLAETLSGPGGEEQSAVARRPVKRKTTLGAEYANPHRPGMLADSLMQLARQVSRL
ncbi:substrate-binding domain-containing protein [Enterobacter hormaechei]